MAGWEDWVLSQETWHEGFWEGNQKLPIPRIRGLWPGVSCREGPQKAERPTGLATWALALSNPTIFDLQGGSAGVSDGHREQDAFGGCGRPGAVGWGWRGAHSLSPSLTETSVSPWDAGRGGMGGCHPWVSSENAVDNLGDRVGEKMDEDCHTHT